MLMYLLAPVIVWWCVVAAMLNFGGVGVELWCAHVLQWYASEPLEKGVAASQQLQLCPAPALLSSPEGPSGPLSWLGTIVTVAQQV